MLEFLKKNPITFAMGHFVKERYRDLVCLRNFRQERAIARPEGPVRVGFLCQYLPAWQKVAPIYERMLADPRFDPCLICVPSEQVMAKESFAATPENDTYDYFSARGYDAINALTGPDTWLDLQTLGLSYIFYPRPYNHLLPAPYHPRQVSRYCRICIVLYGISFAQEDMHTSLNRDFMSCVYYYFALPVINLKSASFWGFLLFIAICYFVLMGIFPSFGTNDAMNNRAFDPHLYQEELSIHHTQSLADHRRVLLFLLGSFCPLELGLASNFRPSRKLPHTQAHR